MGAYYGKLVLDWTGVFFAEDFALGMEAYLVSVPGDFRPLSFDIISPCDNSLAMTSLIVYGPNS